MAGKPGRSGGARPGAGRKPKLPVVINVEVPPSIETLTHKDPQLFLMALMNDISADVKVRADAAKALMPFMHQKKGEAGKKEERADAAKKVAGRFSPSAPPKLVAAGGKKVA